jgi:hypothetical protein
VPDHVHPGDPQAADRGRGRGRRELGRDRDAPSDADEADGGPDVVDGGGDLRLEARRHAHVEVAPADVVGAGFVGHRGEADFHVREPPAHLGERAADDLRADRRAILVDGPDRLFFC